MDSRNAKRTAKRRSSPQRHPAQMVMPDREMPGQVAMACPAPMMRASVTVAFLAVFRPRRSLSQP